MIFVSCVPQHIVIFSIYSIDFNGGCISVLILQRVSWWVRNILERGLISLRWQRSRFRSWERYLGYGMFDAQGHVRFGSPMAFTASVVEYGDQMQKVNNFRGCSPK